MSRFFSNIVANDAVRRRLGEEILQGTLSHAYIIEGPRGSGKHTLALQIAAALSCEKKGIAGAPLPCMNCINCKKILGRGSPDIITVSREDGKATLGVEAIRGLRSDVWVAPNDTDVKVYLVEDAHLMTVQAQNAFLLTLEEPPAYVLFFLLCESSSLLLETIRSRAQTIKTEPVSVEQMDRYLCEAIPEARALKAENPLEFSELLATADGKLGVAIELLSPAARTPLLERRQIAKEFFRLCLERRDAMTVLRYLKSLEQKRETLIQQLSSMELCLRDLLACKRSECAPLCFFADGEEAGELAYRFTMPELIELHEALSLAIQRLRANANVKLTLQALAVNAGLLRI